MSSSKGLFEAVKEPLWQRHLGTFKVSFRLNEKPNKYTLQNAYLCTTKMLHSIFLLYSKMLPLIFHRLDQTFISIFHHFEQNVHFNLLSFRPIIHFYLPSFRPNATFNLPSFQPFIHFYLPSLQHNVPFNLPPTQWNNSNKAMTFDKNCQLSSNPLFQNAISPFRPMLVKNCQMF